MSVFKTDVNNAKLNIILMLDSSGSMTGARIGQLNLGVRECLDLIKEMDGLEEVNVEIRIMQFDGVCAWVLGNERSTVWEVLTRSMAGDASAVVAEQRQMMEAEQGEAAGKA